MSPSLVSTAPSVARGWLERKRLFQTSQNSETKTHAHARRRVSGEGTAGLDISHRVRYDDSRSRIRGWAKGSEVKVPGRSGWRRSREGVVSRISVGSDGRTKSSSTIARRVWRWDCQSLTSAQSQRRVGGGWRRRERVSRVGELRVDRGRSGVHRLRLVRRVTWDSSRNGGVRKAQAPTSQHAGFPDWQSVRESRRAQQGTPVIPRRAGANGRRRREGRSREVVVGELSGGRET